MKTALRIVVAIVLLALLGYLAIHSPPGHRCSGTLDPILRRDCEPHR